MRYFRINTFPVDSDDYCFFSSPPVGIELTDYKLATGVPFSAEYPEDVQLRMSARYPGMRLPDLVGNARSLLIVSRPLRDCIATFDGSSTEYLPVSIVDHKGRTTKMEYFFVNPLGFSECLDLSKSDIEWFEDEVVAVRRFALDPAKIDGLPDLFRIPQEPTQYVISEKLARSLVPLNPSNVFLIELAEAS